MTSWGNARIQCFELRLFSFGVRATFLVDQLISNCHQRPRNLKVKCRGCLKVEIAANKPTGGNGPASHALFGF